MQDSQFSSSTSAAGRVTTAEFAYIHPLQAGKVLAMIYAVIAMVFVPIMILAGFARDGGQVAGAVIVGLYMLVMYPLGGFVGGILMGVLYNFVAKQIGGIRVDLR